MARCCSYNTIIFRMKSREVEGIIRPRCSTVWAFTNLHTIDNHVRKKINEAGFFYIITMGQIGINQRLVSSLIETWRLEMHTFHFPHREATITLEDVTLQLSLKIDGLPVTSIITSDVRVACHALLGDTPPNKYIKGKSIYLSWLRQKFKQLPVDTNDNVVTQHAKGHILMMIGGCLLLDTSGARVYFMYLLLLCNLTEASHYSWGGAVLATLF